MSINVWSILKFFAYVAIIMFFLFPIAWIFNMSFMTNDEILRKVPVLFYEPTFKNYIVYGREKLQLRGLPQCMFISNKI